MGGSLYIKDAICLARKLDASLQFPQKPQTVSRETYSFDDAGMCVPSQELIKCSYVDPVASLVNHVQTARNVNVGFFASDVLSSRLGFALRTSEKDVAVLFPASASFCCKRFVIVKELIHQCDERYASTDTSAKSLVDVIESAMGSFDPMRPWDPIGVEDFCYYCALEILLPWGANGEKRKRLLDFRRDGIPDMVIAEAFRIPVMIVQDISSQYLCLSSQINQSMPE